MKKKPFVTKEKLEEIVKKYPTPFHLYDEKGIRENAKAVKEAFSWNPGFREYFAVKATPNPYILDILKEYDWQTPRDLTESTSCFPQTIHLPRSLNLPMNLVRSST